MSWKGGVALAAVVIVAGCGGGGGQATEPPPAAADTSLVGAVKVTVDVVNNTAKIEPVADSRAMFTGGALSFTTETVLNEGVPARKVLNVKLRDNTREQAVLGASAFRLHFSGIRNLYNPLSSLVGTVKTGTYFGTTNGSTVDGSVANALTNAPKDVAFQPDSRVLFFSEGATLRMVRNDTVSTLVSFLSIKGLSVLPACPRFPEGAAILADETDHRVWAVEPNGRKTHLAGNGTAGGVIGGTAQSSQVSSPSALAVYVPPDKQTARVWVASFNSLHPLNVDLDLTNGGNDQYAASVGQTLTGLSMVCDKDYLYALHSLGILVQKFENMVSGSAVGGMIGAIGGSSGDIDGTGVAARFNGLTQITKVDDVLYVTDRLNHKVKQVALRPGGNPLAPGAWWVSTLSGTGVAGTVDGTTTMRHNGPFGIASSGGEGLFVTDNLGGRMRTIDPLTGKFTVLAGSPTVPPTDDPVLANPDGYLPNSVARTPFQDESPNGFEGVMSLKPWKFIVPNGTQSFEFMVSVQAKTETLAVLPSVHNPGPVSGAGSPDVSVTTLAGTYGTLFQSDGPGHTATFSSMRGICSDTFGNLYVGDGGTTVRLVTSNGNVHTIAGNSTTASTVSGLGSVARFLNITAIACSPDGGEIFVADGPTVRRMTIVGFDRTSPDSWFVGGEVAGLASTAGSGSLATVPGSAARFSNIADLVYASPNTVYVLDSGHSNVRSLAFAGGDRSSSANWNVALVAGSAVGGGGYVDSVRENARFNTPLDMTLHPTGDLYVSDINNRRVRQVTVAGVVTTVAGGSYGYADGVGTAALFRDPLGIVADPAGYMYLGDGTNLLIRRISPKFVVTTVAGILQVSGTFNDGSGATAKVSPYLMTLGPGGDLYFTDSTRIRVAERVIRD